MVSAHTEEEHRSGYRRSSTDPLTVQRFVVPPTFHFGQQKSIAGSVFTAKDSAKVKTQNRKSIIAQGIRKVLRNMRYNSDKFQMKSRPMCSGAAVTLTCSLYLNDSMPFFVDPTKNGCLSVLVMWTRPPPLSMAPEWIAALQILDCWEHNSASVGNTSGTNATNNKWRRDSPRRGKEFPTLSLSYSCNWQDIYTCRRTNMS